MKKLLLSLLFSLLCLSIDGATLEPLFQLGEKQKPQLDKLLPNVASRITFNKDSTKLIAHEMGGMIVEWDLQKRQKRAICNVEPGQWSAYTLRSNYLLTPKADNGISVVSVANSDEIPFMKRSEGGVGKFVNIEDELNGQYTNGFFSQDSELAALTKGDNEIELWRFAYMGLLVNPMSSKTIITPLKLYNFKTQLPVRNGIVISPTHDFMAAAEGTYRDSEGHRTIIEIWELSEKQPIQVFNTGEILGVWNMIFSDYPSIFATDTQLNGKSGIRVWDITDGRQLLNKSGFDAYWIRALAFAPIDFTREEPLCMFYLASGDEKGNLRVWGIPYDLEKIPETQSVIWETYPTGIQALAFSPNGEYLAVALWDATIQILRWKNDESKN